MLSTQTQRQILLDRVTIDADTSLAGSLRRGDTVSISIDLANQGTSAETFDVDLLSDNGTPGDAGDDFTVATWTGVNLAGGDATTLNTNWDTTGASLATHTLTATATLATDEDPADNSASTGVEITVPAAEISVAAIDPDSMLKGTTITDVTITGSGFQFGATVTFENFPGATPIASNVVVVESNTITLDVTVGTNGPNKDRAGDVRVTNPDSSTGSCEDCFTVMVNGASSAATSNVVTAPSSSDTDEALATTGDTTNPTTTTDPLPAADTDPLPQPTQGTGSGTVDNTNLIDLAFTDPATLDDSLLADLATALAG